MNKIIFAGCLNLMLFINFQKITTTTSSPYTHIVDSVFRFIDKSPISTGILYDRVFPFARLDKCAPNQHYITNYQHFRQAYAELYYSHYHPEAQLLSPDDWDDILDWHRFKKNLPIGVLDMRYNQVKTSAIKKKLLIQENGYFFNNPKKKETPFEEKNIQLTSLLADYIDTGTVTIKLLPELLLSNTGRTVKHIDITIEGQPDTYSLQAGDSVNVKFTKEGITNVNTSVFFTNGESFTSKSTIEVKMPAIESKSIPTKMAHQPCYKETVIADIPFTGYDETFSTKGQVEVNYFYHHDTTDQEGCVVKPLKKPIIVLDGFDPTDKRNANWIYEHNFSYFNEKKELTNFADEQRLQGFDIIIINMPSYQSGEKNIVLPNGEKAHIGTLRRAGGDFIEINAMALIKVIQNINEQLAANNSKEKIIIVGPSMGGVISRYALSYMEKKGMDHNCRLWFSWDATHLGSVLPIGNQYFIESMANLGLRNVKDIIARQINSPASKQELNHHFLANSPQPEGAPEFKDRFYDGIDSIGWPQHTRKIAMISGAIKGLSQPRGEPGGTAFDFKLKMNDVPRLLLFNVAGFFLNPTFIKAKISFSPSQSMSNTEVLDMKILGIPIQKKYAQPFSFSNNSMDLIQGGWYPGFQEIRDSTRDKLKGFFKWVADPKFLNVVENHCHQPSANTLAFGQGPHPNPNRKWDDDLSLVNFNCGDEKEVPWDAWYAPEINLRHDSLTYEYAWRMRDEMNGIPMPQPKVTRKVYISGDTNPIHVGEERKFIIPAANKQTIYNWTISHPNLQIISGQGSSEITVKCIGDILNQCEIGCTAISDCYIYQITSSIINEKIHSNDITYK